MGDDVFDIGKPRRKIRERNNKTEGEADGTGVLSCTSGWVAYWQFVTTWCQPSTHWPAGSLSQAHRNRCRPWKWPAEIQAAAFVSSRGTGVISGLCTVLCFIAPILLIGWQKDVRLKKCHQWQFPKFILVDIWGLNPTFSNHLKDWQDLVYMMIMILDTVKKPLMPELWEKPGRS